MPEPTDPDAFRVTVTFHARSNAPGVWTLDVDAPVEWADTYTVRAETSTPTENLDEAKARLMRVMRAAGVAPKPVLNAYINRLFASTRG